jgi:hypothetical protein
MANMFAQKHIRMLIGTLDDESFPIFERVILDELNGVVGINVIIAQEIFEREHQDGRLAAHFSGEKLIISKSIYNDSGTELNINGHFSPQWGTICVDGFFTVKSGGMFQGTCCFGLLPVDQALIVLNPSIKIIKVKLQDN